MNLVVIFEDELDQETKEELLEDLQETGLTELTSFDNNCKMVVSISDEIPDPDYLIDNPEGKITDYWHAVIDESMRSCCGFHDESEIGVYAVKTVKQFREASNMLNDGAGPYEDILKEFE